MVDDQTETLKELAVIEPGYSPLYQDLQERLGGMSLNSVNIEAAMTEAETSKANYKLLVEFSKMLPKANGHRFELEGSDIQYLIRQIQANVIDVNGRPHFLIGEHDLEENETELLLLLADGAQDDTHSWEVMTAIVRQDSMDARDQYAQSLEGQELTEGEIEGIRRNGKAAVHGAVELYPVEDRELRPEEHRNALQYQRWRTRGYDERSPLIPMEVFERFGVNTAIAKLAIAFRVEDKLRTFLGETKAKPELTGGELVEALESQNKDLKSNLKNMLMAGGLSETDAEEVIRQRYPDYR